MNTSAIRAKRRRITHRCAFTLIELLTVIAIIGILAAIIIPTVGRVRESANKVKCLSNVRQLATVWQLHVQDNREIVLIATAFDDNRTDKAGTKLSWVDYLAHLYTQDSQSNASLRGILNCPSQLKKKPGLSIPSRTYSLNKDLNRHAKTGLDWPNRPLSSIVLPSRTLLLGDGYDDGNPGYYGSILSSMYAGKPNWPDTVHAGHTNIAYVDGHAASVKTEEPLFKPGGVWSDPGTPEALFWYGE